MWGPLQWGDTGLNSQHREQEEGLDSQGAGGPWLEDHARETGVGVGGADSDCTDPRTLATGGPGGPAPPRGWGTGDEDPSDGKGDQGSRHTHLQLLVKLDSAEAKRSLKAEALLIKELYKA